MQINDKVKFQQINITLESELDIAIMLALIESSTSHLDVGVTRELFKITGVDERRNVDEKLITDFLETINQFLLDTINYNKELKEED